MFEYITAGESHGPELTTIIKKVPAGLKLDFSELNRQLLRRQGGYGRGGRMKIESDQAQITSGVRQGKTLGTPLTIRINNKDWQNWRKIMAIEPRKAEDKESKEEGRVSKPRPGHADLAGAQKFNFRDLRNVLERASARETAARSAVGAVCRQFLAHFNINIFSHVIQIGEVASDDWSARSEQFKTDSQQDLKAKIKDYFSQVDNSPLRCGSKEKTREMKKLIDAWKEQGDSVGGVFEVIITGLPPGLGSHTHWDFKLDGQLAGAFMSIQAIKGVEIGAGFAGAALAGSQFHDEIYHQQNRGFYRSSNRAGGLEGGITNGEFLTIKAAMKPIPTLSTPLHSVEIDTKNETTAAKERSDNCAVPSASIVGEAVAAITIAKALTLKTGGDSMAEIKRNYNSYLEQIKNF